MLFDLEEHAGGDYRVGEAGGLGCMRELGRCSRRFAMPTLPATMRTSRMMVGDKRRAAFFDGGGDLEVGSKIA